MLIEFTVSNYRSIRAKQTLSMVASNYSDELPQNLISCKHVPGLKEVKLVKAAVIYGANASGKSNIINAFRFFAKFIRDSATALQPNAATGTQPFKLDPVCLAKSTKFEITTIINGVRMLHGLELTSERVTREYVVAYPKAKPQIWFEREWDGQKYKWSKSTEQFKHDAALRGKIRENASFVSVAAQFNHTQAKVLLAWYDTHLSLTDLEYAGDKGLLTRIMVAKEKRRVELLRAVKSADLGAVELQVRQPNLRETLEYAVLYQGGSPSRAKMDALELQKELEASKDESLAEVRGKLDDLIQKLATPELVHQGVGTSKVALNYYEEESSGTRRFIELVAQLIAARELNQLAVFDELETSLHPLLAKALLEFMAARTESPHTSQLLFTTHNPLLLDQTLLRRDQIWFTEKDQEGATRLYPLTDFKPRKDESLIKGYLSGRYGGIPFIPAGLNADV